MFPHAKGEPAEYGHSPGNGMTPRPISRDPLATEGEASPGPDDENPFEEPEGTTLDQSPTAGDDPFVFDDVDEAVDEVRLPGFDFF